MMEVERALETSVDNYFTRQYIPEDNSEVHTRRRENLKSHIEVSSIIFDIDINNIIIKRLILQNTYTFDLYSSQYQVPCNTFTLNARHVAHISTYVKIQEHFKYIKSVLRRENDLTCFNFIKSTTVSAGVFEAFTYSTGSTRVKRSHYKYMEAQGGKDV
jgi:hypothetical protein